jgi:hypothetical protein
MPPKRLKVSHFETCRLDFSLLALLIDYLDLEMYNAMLRLNKGMNSYFKTHQSRVLGQYKGNKNFIIARVLGMRYSGIPVSDTVLNDLGASFQISKIEDVSGINLNDPNDIKQCRFPDIWLNKYYQRHRWYPDSDLSLELALHGRSSFLISTVAARTSNSIVRPFSFSTWNPTDKVDVKKVQKLMRYYDIYNAIENSTFANLVYNQPNLELMRLHEGWQQFNLFLKYRTVEYTEEDIRPFGWTAKSALDYQEYGRTIPLWLFKQLFNNAPKLKEPVLLKQFFSRNNINTFKLDGVFRCELPEYKAYFEEIDIWDKMVDYYSTE